MKKNILLSAILCLILNAAFAQSVHFGIKGGADAHKIEGSSFRDKINLGYHAGLFAEIGLPGKLGLQPEVYLSQVNPETMSSNPGAFNFNNASKIKLSYINIPVLLNIKLASIVSLQAGPQFGILINKDSSIVQNGKEAFKSGDAGIAAGLQINVTKIKIYARYVRGLMNVDNTGTGKWQNQNIHVGVGFRIF